MSFGLGQVLFGLYCKLFSIFFDKDVDLGITVAVLRQIHKNRSLRRAGISNNHGDT